MKKIYITTILLLSLFSAVAQDGSGHEHIATFHGVLLGIIGVLTFVLLLVVFVLKKMVHILKVEQNGGVYEEDERTDWEKLLSLKPLSAEKDIDLGHDYDGIRELNNPIPPWFNVLFYGTVIFGVFYIIIYHVMGIAPLQGKEYEKELADAAIQNEAYLAKVGNLIDENSVVYLSDKDGIAKGATVFQENNCKACHGEVGQGTPSAPNLTDAYWLHGGSIKDIFKTIKYGVPGKGMVAWQTRIKPTEMQQLASYILSLQGSNPPGAMPPAGEMDKTNSAAPLDSMPVTAADSAR